MKPCCNAAVTGCPFHWNIWWLFVASVVGRRHRMMTTTLLKFDDVHTDNEEPD